MTISLKDVALTADLLQAAAQQLGFETHVSPSPLIQAPTLCSSSVLQRCLPSQTSPHSRQAPFGVEAADHCLPLPEGGGGPPPHLRLLSLLR